MTNVTIKSYRFETEIKIMSALEKAMGQVGGLVERQAKENVSQSPPEHPQVQTGRLRSSIANRVEKSGSEISTLIGSNVNYAPYLEFGTSRHSPYPWLFPAVETSRDKIVEILKGSVMTGTPGNMTWNKFTGERMGQYMKTYGGHAGAIKQIAKEWKEYKAGNK